MDAWGKLRIDSRRCARLNERRFASAKSFLQKGDAPMKSFRAAAGLAVVIAAATAPAAAQWDGFLAPDWTKRAETPTSHLLLGAPTAAPYSYYYRYPEPYPYIYAPNGCLVDAAMFDDWGIFRGYQRLRVAC
jgi:hypothetical protein